MYILGRYVCWTRFRTVSMFSKYALSSNRSMWFWRVNIFLTGLFFRVFIGRSLHSLFDNQGDVTRITKTSVKAFYCLLLFDALSSFICPWIIKVHGLARKDFYLFAWIFFRSTRIRRAVAFSSVLRRHTCLCTENKEMIDLLEKIEGAAETVSEMLVLLRATRLLPYGRRHRMPLIQSPTQSSAACCFCHTQSPSRSILRCFPILTSFFFIFAALVFFHF